MRKRWHYTGRVTQVITEVLRDASSVMNQSKALGKIAKKALIVMFIALGGLIIEDILHFGVFPWHFWAIWFVFWMSCSYSTGLNLKRTGLLRLHSAMLDAVQQLDEIPTVGEPNISLAIDKMSYRERFRNRLEKSS